VGLPVLVYVLIHYTSLVYGSTVHSPFGSAEYIHDNLALRRRLDGNFINSVVFAFATSFGGVWMLAVLGFRRAPRFLRATAIILPALGLIFLNASDWDRVLTFAFPVVIVLACRVPLRWPVLVVFLVVDAWLSGVAIGRITGTYTGQLNPQTLLTVTLLAVACAIVVTDAVTMKEGYRPRVLDEFHASSTPRAGHRIGLRTRCCRRFHFSEARA
jgi:hypothetical protein